MLTMQDSILLTLLLLLGICVGLITITLVLMIVLSFVQEYILYYRKNKGREGHYCDFWKGFWKDAWKLILTFLRFIVNVSIFPFIVYFLLCVSKFITPAWEHLVLAIPLAILALSWRLWIKHCEKPEHYSREWNRCELPPQKNIIPWRILPWLVMIGIGIGISLVLTPSLTLNVSSQAVKFYIAVMLSALFSLPMLWYFSNPYNIYRYIQIDREDHKFRVEIIKATTKADNLINELKRGKWGFLIAAPFIIAFAVSCIHTRNPANLIPLCGDLLKNTGENPDFSHWIVGYSAWVISIVLIVIMGIIGPIRSLTTGKPESVNPRPSKQKETESNKTCVEKQLEEKNEEKEIEKTRQLKIRTAFNILHQYPKYFLILFTALIPFAIIQKVLITFPSPNLSILKLVSILNTDYVITLEKPLTFLLNNQITLAIGFLLFFVICVFAINKIDSRIQGVFHGRTFTVRLIPFLPILMLSLWVSFTLHVNDEVSLFKEAGDLCPFINILFLSLNKLILVYPLLIAGMIFLVMPLSYQWQNLYRRGSVIRERGSNDKKTERGSSNDEVNTKQKETTEQLKWLIFKPADISIRYSEIFFKRHLLVSILGITIPVIALISEIVWSHSVGSTFSDLFLGLLSFLASVFVFVLPVILNFFKNAEEEISLFVADKVRRLIHAMQFHTVVVGYGRFGKKVVKHLIYREWRVHGQSFGIITNHLFKLSVLREKIKKEMDRKRRKELQFKRRELKEKIHNFFARTETNWIQILLPDLREAYFSPDFLIIEKDGSKLSRTFDDPVMKSVGYVEIKDDFPASLVPGNEIFIPAVVADAREEAVFDSIMKKASAIITAHSDYMLDYKIVKDIRTEEPHQPPGAVIAVEDSMQAQYFGGKRMKETLFISYPAFEGGLALAARATHFMLKKLSSNITGAEGFKILLLGEGKHTYYFCQRLFVNAKRMNISEPEIHYVTQDSWFDKYLKDKRGMFKWKIYVGHETFKTVNAYLQNPSDICYLTTLEKSTGKNLNIPLHNLEEFDLIVIARSSGEKNSSTYHQIVSYFDRLRTQKKTIDTAVLVGTIGDESMYVRDASMYFSQIRDEKRDLIYPTQIQDSYVNTFDFAGHLAAMSGTTHILKKECVVQRDLEPLTISDDSVKIGVCLQDTYGALLKFLLKLSRLVAIDPMEVHKPLPDYHDVYVHPCPDNRNRKIIEGLISLTDETYENDWKDYVKVISSSDESIFNNDYLKLDYESGYKGRKFNELNKDFIKGKCPLSSLCVSTSIIKAAYPVLCHMDEYLKCITRVTKETIQALPKRMRALDSISEEEKNPTKYTNFARILVCTKHINIPGTMASVLAQLSGKDVKLEKNDNKDETGKRIVNILFNRSYRCLQQGLNRVNFIGLIDELVRERELSYLTNIVDYIVIDVLQGSQTLYKTYANWLAKRLTEICGVEFDVQPDENDKKGSDFPHLSEGNSIYIYREGNNICRFERRTRCLLCSRVLLLKHFPKKP